MEFAFSQGLSKGLGGLGQALANSPAIRQQYGAQELDQLVGAELKAWQAKKFGAESRLAQELLKRTQRRDADLEEAAAASAGLTLPEYRGLRDYQRTGQAPTVSVPDVGAMTGSLDEQDPPRRDEPRYAWQSNPLLMNAGRRALAATSLGGQMKDIDPRNITQAQGELQQQGTSGMALDALAAGNVTGASALNQIARPGNAVKLFENVGNTGATMAPATGAVTATGPLAEAEVGRRTADVKLKQDQGEAALALARKRDAPTVVVAGGRGGAQKAPVGYRFSSDGETLEPIPGGPKDAGAKPLPSSVVKLQREELDAIATSGGIASDLAAINKQIEDKTLDLGLFSNLLSQGRNYIGKSDETSRNYATFQATLEKLRNESLRLNKGVQTEGDAVRAWNELIQSANDPKVVQQRIGEIIKINERAADLRRMNLDVMRQNYGLPPLDVTDFARQPAAVGAGGSGRGGAGATGSWDGTERRGAAPERRQAPAAPRVMRFDANGNPVQ